MKRAISAVVLVLALPLTVLACLWDRDTPLDEALGMPEVVAAITGRFERNPPLFYEMRLALATEHLRDAPEDLSAYDDAGVACDRLGRGDDAIAWMEKKREQLDKLDRSRPEVEEQRYRYHANLGTFLVHRWARAGADRSKIDEVKAARDEIAKALEINPQAHFGREKYQLMALNWIIEPPALPAKHVRLPDLLSLTLPSGPKPKEAHEAVRGLAGLVVLGNAWESVDVFAALSRMLEFDTTAPPGGLKPDGGRTHLAHLARFRAEELIRAGKGSMLPDAPQGEDLLSAIYHPMSMEDDGLREHFVQLREEADAWQQARTDFMMNRLAQGRHPDTDANFWAGYTESTPPRLMDDSQGARNQRTVTRVAWSGIAILVAGVALVSAVVIVLVRMVASRRKPRVVGEL